MNKHFVLLLTFLCSSLTFAQNDCQEIIPYISSSSIEAIPGINPSSNDSVLYYDLCQADSLFLDASAEFPENNTNYNQTVEATTFTWSLDGVLHTTGPNFSEFFGEAGGYVVTLHATDSMGCSTVLPATYYIRVSTTPTINLSFSESLICPGVETLIGTTGTGDVSYTVAYEPGGFESLPCEDEFAEPLYLPDGSGAVYSTDIVLNCFGEGQVLTDVNDLLSVDMNIEHSYTGDLDILLTAPNGVQVTLFEQAGGGTWFGEATDGDATETNPGVGYDYGWSINPSYNGTMADGMPANVTDGILNSDTYLPLGDFTDFVGTPLNGTWTITVIDNLTIDNGWIFSWGLSIAQDIVPSAWSFDNYIVDEYWQDAANIVSNTGNTITILPEPGEHTYTYEIVDNFNCSYTESASITATSYVQASANISNDYCLGGVGAIDLNISGGTPGYNIEWNTNETTTELDNLHQGTYYYDIVDDLGCTESGSALVQNEDLILDFNITTSYDHCDQSIGDITLSPTNGSNPYTYIWESLPSTTSEATNLLAGNYQVNIIDGDGCLGQEIIEVINVPGPTAGFTQSADTVVYVDGLVDFYNQSYSHPLTNLVSYHWNFDDGGFSSQVNPNHDFNNMGQYTVQLTVTDGGGCEDLYEAEINAVEDYFIWAPTVFTPNGDTRNDLFRPILRNVIASTFEMYIYDRWGRQVYFSNNYDLGWNGIRQDNGVAAEIGGYTFVVRFNTHRNELQEEIGSFIILK